MYSKKVYT